MATEYYWPYDLGGSEWSTHYLAKGLISAGHEVLAVTPNYGSAKSEIKDKVKILRFTIPIKVRNNRPISPFWHTNIIWIIITTYHLIKICKREKVDVLHLQGKYYSPAGFFVKKLLGIPVLLTVRDYQLICNYGFCIWHKSKACDLKNYFTDDFAQYYETYVAKKSTTALLTNLIFAVRARIVRNIYKYFAAHLDKIVCISNAQAKIYKANNFKNISVIYNSTEFKINNTKPRNKILYAGRLTPGKGVELLLKAMPVVWRRFPKLKLVIFGEGFLKNGLENISSRYSKGKIKFAGHISHGRLLKEYANSLAVVMPSVWPEPFGRVSLESISQGTPAVVTNVGGLPEIVENGKTGYICEPNANNLSMAIKKSLKENNKLRKNIQLAQQHLRQKFEIENMNQYINLYKKLV